MNDLVEQLRKCARVSNDGYLCGPALEAAARITELESDLTRYVESLHYMREAADRQRAFMQSAHVDGVRAGLEAAAKAILVAQYDPAPYTKASYAIRALDPEAIVRAGIKVTPTP